MNCGRSSLTPVLFSVVDIDVNGLGLNGHHGGRSPVLSTVETNSELSEVNVHTEGF